MNRFNKFIFLFCMIVLVVFYILVHIIQSGEVATFISDRIQPSLQKEFNIELDFDQLEVGFIPPATTLKNVLIHSKKENVSIEAESVKLSFSIFDFFTDKISLENISIKNGRVELNKYFESKEGKDKNKIKRIEDVFNLYKGIYKENDSVRIKKVSLANIYLNVQDINFFIKNFSLLPSNESVSMKIDIGNIQKILYQKYLPELDIDRVFLNFKLEGKELKFYEVKIDSDLSKVALSGNVEDGKNESLEVNLAGLYNGDISIAPRIVPTLELIKGMTGFGKIKFAIGNNSENPDVNVSGDIYELRSRFAKVDHLKFSVGLLEDIFRIKSSVAKIGSGVISLKKPIALIDIKSKKYVDRKISLEMSNVFTRDALFVIDETLSPLKGYLSGDVDLKIRDKDIIFEINEGARLDKFVLGEYSNPILKNQGLIFKKTTISLNDNFDTFYNIRASLGETLLTGEGKINDDGVYFNVFSEKFNFEDLGKISDVKINGVGPIQFDVLTINKKIFFDIKANHKNFSLLGYNLNNIDAFVRFWPKTNKMSLLKVNGNNNSLKYSGAGFFDFSNDSFNLDYSISEADFSDLLNTFEGLMKPLDFLPKDLIIRVNSVGKIDGFFNDRESINVKGHLVGENLSYFGERVRKLETYYSFSKSKLFATDIILSKNKGALFGEAAFDLSTNRMEYKGHIQDLYLHDFNLYDVVDLGYDGKIYGEFSGRGSVYDFRSRTNLKIYDTHVNKKNTRGSEVTIVNNKTDFFVNGNILGQKFIFKSYFNTDKKNNKKSSLNVEVDTEDIAEAFGVISSHNILNEDLKGHFKGKLSSTFSIFDLKSLDVKLDIQKFLLEKNKNSIRMISFDPLIIVDGVINSWDLKFDGTSKIDSKGRGDFKSSYRIENKFSFNATFLELFSDKVLLAKGNIDGRYINALAKNNHTSYFESFSEGMSIDIEGIPGSLSKIKSSLIIDGNTLSIKNIEGQFGKGIVRVNGGVNFGLGFPNLDLNVEVEKSYIPLFKKSNVVFSADGKVTGTKFPYLVSGNISLLHADILDSFNELIEDTNLDENYRQFLPKENLNNQKEYLTFDLELSTFRNLNVKNQLVDMELYGDFKAKGGPKTLYLNGELKSDSSKSKFLFKGHEFLIKDGSIILRDKDQKLPPVLKFVGITDIGVYTISLNVYGPTDNLKIELNSEPALSQEDILSLITLGVTSDITKNLEEKDREKVTTLGLGTLLVDQFKINEGLNSSLGLKMSVLPEFSNDETSLIQGRSGVTENNSSKIKSATKVKLEKKLSEKVDLSVSTTVGGTLEQKQEMNVKFKLNDSVSLEGVYELKTQGQDEEIDDSESAGADIKWRWSF